MCVPVYTEQEVIEEVWPSLQELSAAQWELCYYWTKHFTSRSLNSPCLSLFSPSLYASFSPPLPSPSSAERNICYLAGNDAMSASPWKSCTKAVARISFFFHHNSFLASSREAVLHLSAIPPLTSVPEDSREQLSRLPCALKHTNEFIFWELSQGAKSTFGMQRSHLLPPSLHTCLALPGTGRCSRHLWCPLCPLSVRWEWSLWNKQGWLPGGPL